MALDGSIVEMPARDPLGLNEVLDISNLTLDDVKLKAYFGSLPTREVDF